MWSKWVIPTQKYPLLWSQCLEIFLRSHTVSSFRFWAQKVPHLWKNSKGGSIAKCGEGCFSPKNRWITVEVPNKHRFHGNLNHISVWSSTFPSMISLLSGSLVHYASITDYFWLTLNLLGLPGYLILSHLRCRRNTDFGSFHFLLILSDFYVFQRERALSNLKIKEILNLIMKWLLFGLICTIVAND